MSNYHVEPIDQPKALTPQAIKALRKEQVQGLSRRQLIRVALGAGIGLATLEALAGTVAFAWPSQHHAPDLRGLPRLLRRSPRVRGAQGPGPATVYPR
jgi:hypothetical protein